MKSLFGKSLKAKNYFGKMKKFWTWIMVRTMCT